MRVSESLYVSVLGQNIQGKAFPICKSHAVVMHESGVEEKMDIKDIQSTPDPCPRLRKSKKGLTTNIRHHLIYFGIGSSGSNSMNQALEIRSKFFTVFRASIPLTDGECYHKLFA